VWRFAERDVVAEQVVVRIMGGGNIGKDPIISSVFTEVFNVGKDLMASFDGGPQQIKDTTRHIRMTNNVVLCIQTIL